MNNGAKNKEIKGLGIDLGTCNSSAALIDEDGNIEILLPETGVLLGGRKAYPSCVAFKPDGTILVGEPAMRQQIMNPENTFIEFKRMIGQGPQSSLDGKDPLDLSRIILAKIKGDAERTYGTTFSSAVVTVPAFFNDTQREATKLAGTLAGFKTITILNEPTAAAISYGYENALKNETILVFDLGGGTLDITIMNIDPATQVYDVIGTYGDNYIGGKDIDKVLIKHFQNLIQKKHSVDFSKNSRVMAQLKNTCEALKIELSSSPSAFFNFDFVHEGRQYTVSEEISRSDFEKLISKFTDACREVVEKALVQINIDRSKVDSVLLIGGPTRIPAIQKMLAGLFKNPPRLSVDPMTAVCRGAAIKAGSLTGSIKGMEAGGIIDLDVTPFSLGIELVNDTFSVIIPRNSKIPTGETKTYTNVQDYQQKVDIRILQGERKLASYNHYLGTFSLPLKPVPRGTAQIEVTFDIDYNGIISVSAVDKATGIKQSTKVQKTTDLSSEEIKRRIEESERFIEHDNLVLEVGKQMETLSSLRTQLETCGKSSPNFSSLSAEIEAMEGQANTIRSSPSKPSVDSFISKVEEIRDKVLKACQEAGSESSGGDSQQHESRSTEGESGEKDFS